MQPADGCFCNRCINSVAACLDICCGWMGSEGDCCAAHQGLDIRTPLPEILPQQMKFCQSLNSLINPAIGPCLTIVKLCVHV